MTQLEAIIIAIVEGITEFLPISSTGHMLLAEAFLGIKSDDFVKMFTVMIQFGAILSVLVLYWKRFFQTTDFYLKLFVAFLPAAFFGLLLGDWIDSLLESIPVVAATLFIGGIILLKVDNWFNPNGEDRKMSFVDSLIIGLFQCIALVPGVSRSASTIIGGLARGFNRKQAAEFSFFLAVPTMFAASAYKLLKNYETIGSEHIGLLIIGNVVAFVVALLAIKFFIGWLTKHGFKLFGYYRIALGLLLFVLMALGFEMKI